MRGELLGGRGAFRVRLRWRGARSSPLRWVCLVGQFEAHAAAALNVGFLEPGWRWCWVRLRHADGKTNLIVGNARS